MAEIVTPTVIVNMRCHVPDVACDRSSIFGNPFDHNRLGITRQEACERFEEYFIQKLTDPKFYDKVMALKGKRLGCWCRCLPPCNNPKCKSHRCHVETIVNFLETV